MTYVVQLARTRYAGTNHTHLTELLMEREGIDLSLRWSTILDNHRRTWGWVVVTFLEVRVGQTCSRIRPVIHWPVGRCLLSRWCLSADRPFPTV